MPGFSKSKRPDIYYFFVVHKITSDFMYVVNFYWLILIKMLFVLKFLYIFVLRITELLILNLN